MVQEIEPRAVCLLGKHSLLSYVPVKVPFLGALSSSLPINPPGCVTLPRFPFALAVPAAGHEFCLNDIPHISHKMSYPLQITFFLCVG